jgi:HD superfamily phosphodiesterase
VSAPLPLLRSEENQLGRDVTGAVPPPDGLTGVIDFRALDAQVWRRAATYLQVRSNDGHTLYAYGLARALVDLHPEADPDVVLPAILLHDTGWSQVDPDEVLEAIAPGQLGSRPDLVRQHEVEGARIAGEVLAELNHDPERTARIVEIIDGHDSRRHSLSVEDSLVKDADKLWRLTPHGVDTVMAWFGLDRAQAHRLIAGRVHDHLFTAAARNIARALGALASMDTVPARLEVS